MLIGAAICAATSIGVGGLAAAGGINGNGEPTDVSGRSLCAGSGLNPAYPEESDVRTQGWGTAVSAAFKTEGQDAIPGLFFFKDSIGPGTGEFANCRGNDGD